MSLDHHLREQGLLPSTRSKYASIVASGGRSPVEWLRNRLSTRLSIGTVLPLRAAVKHYLMAQGYEEEEIANLLPKAKGRPSGTREALSPEQLVTYYLVAEEQGEPVRTILLLLPRTGLRISEICNLRAENIVHRGGVRGLLFRGKRDEERFVPLNRAAQKALDEHLSERQPDGWLFDGYLGGPITPAAVRKVTRAMREEYPELGELSPHVLRHTCFTLALRKGADLRTIQALAGHKNITTTSRYLHPDAGMLRDAVENLE
jgi:integrase/recombinase XerC